MNDFFNRFARWAADVTGSAWAYLVATGIILVWAVTGPIFRYSDTWQLVINTATTVVTFLMVFLIQNTQNRDAKAMHLKLDELIRSHKGARNSMIDLERLTDEQLVRLQQEFDRICTEGTDTGSGGDSNRRQDRASSTGDRAPNPGPQPL